MFFYYVKKGDNLYDISKEFQVPVAKIIEDNGLTSKNNLSIGQCLIIDPVSKIYVVKKNDTLGKIASNLKVSIDDIKKWNNLVSDNLLVGQKLLIDYQKHSLDKIKVNGYCYEGINEDILRKSLPYLTYLSIFAYKVDEDGNLNTISDQRLIDIALDYDVAPLMVVTNIKQKGGFSSSLISSILNDEVKVNNLLNNVLNALQRKKYYGVNFDFEYIYQDDKDKFASFEKKAYEFFNSRGYFMSTALAPKISSSQKGLLYEAHDYNMASRNNDLVILMTYEWGYTYGDSLPVAPFNKVENVIKYAVTEIESEKILMGIPNYGYDFDVPRIANKPAKSISLTKANDLAFEKKASIKYYETYKTPYFVYYEDDKKHEVQFDNAYSFYEKLTLVDKYNLGGISIWTITNYNAQYFTILKNLFIVEKVL